MFTLAEHLSVWLIIACHCLDILIALVLKYNVQLYSVLNLATQLSFESGEEGAGFDNPLQYCEFGLQYHSVSLVSM